MDPTKTASIGTQLSPAMDAALRDFLCENWDIFAWHPSDMPGIPRGLAEHSLNILKGYKPVKQTLRRFSEPKRQALNEVDLGRLSSITSSLSKVARNIVNSSAARALDSASKIIDATAGHDSLCFLDAYSGYHQIIFLFWYHY